MATKPSGKLLISSNKLIIIAGFFFCVFFFIYIFSKSPSFYTITPQHVRLFFCFNCTLLPPSSFTFCFFVFSWRQCKNLILVFVFRAYHTTLVNWVTQKIGFSFFFFFHTQKKKTKKNDEMVINNFSFLQKKNAFSCVCVCVVTL